MSNISFLDFRSGYASLKDDVHQDKSMNTDLSKRLTWLKTMEQLQAGNWLRHGLIERSQYDDKFVPPDSERTTSSIASDVESMSKLQSGRSRLKETDTQKDATAMTAAHKLELSDAPEKSVDFEAVRDTSAINAQAGLHPAFDVNRQPVISSAIGGNVDHPDSNGSYLNADSNLNVVSEKNVNPAPEENTRLAGVPNGKVDQLRDQILDAVKVSLQSWLVSETGLTSFQASNASISGNDITEFTAASLQKAERTLNSIRTDSKLESVDVELHEIESVEKTEHPLNEREPIRFHAEWDGENLSLWLGIDAHMDIDVTKFTRQIQNWFDQHNVQLVSLIWNGQQLTRNVHSNTAIDEKKMNAKSQFFRQDHSNTVSPYIAGIQNLLNSYIVTQEMR